MPRSAEREQKLYQRFKADESAQFITGPYRRLHPEDNNERQAMHEHVSAPLTPGNAKSYAAATIPSSGGGAGAQQ